MSNHFVHGKCRCKAATLSTLRFGERAKNIQNKPVINEITEDDVNGLSDQIRQLKVLKIFNKKSIPFSLTIIANVNFI